MSRKGEKEREREREREESVEEKEMLLRPAHSSLNPLLFAIAATKEDENSARSNEFEARGPADRPSVIHPGQRLPSFLHDSSIREAIVEPAISPLVGRMAFWVNSYLSSVNRVAHLQSLYPPVCQKGRSRSFVPSFIFIRFFAAAAESRYSHTAEAHTRERARQRRRRQITR